MTNNDRDKFFKCCDICATVNVCKELDRNLKRDFQPQNGKWSKPDNSMTTGDYLKDANLNIGNSDEFKYFVRVQIIEPRNSLVHKDFSSFADTQTRDAYQRDFRKVFQILRTIANGNARAATEQINTLKQRDVELMEGITCDSQPCQPNTQVTRIPVQPLQQDTVCVGTATSPAGITNTIATSPPPSPPTPKKNKCCSIM